MRGGVLGGIRTETSLMGEPKDRNPVFLKASALGGSCAMLGEFGEDEDEKEEVPDVKGVSFFDKGPLAKMAVIAAGPLFNFILAFVFPW